MRMKLTPAEHRHQLKQKLLDTSKTYERELCLLVVNWANAESWLVRILAKILDIHVLKADIIFYSITSSRGRAELVERSAIMFLKNERDIRHLIRLLRRFRVITATRNKVCHAEYQIDPSQNAITLLLSTNYGRADFDGTNHVEFTRMSPAFNNEVRQAHMNAGRLCNSFKRFVAKDRPVLKTPRDKPLQLRPRRKTK